MIRNFKYLSIYNLINMDDIKERLGEYRYNYFKNLQNYLETELIFYGSVKRLDYFQNASDIDITIITDNVPSMLSKLKSVLNTSPNDVTKIYQKFHENNVVIKGYKIKYENENENLQFDMLIYDIKYKEIVMENIRQINELPFYIVSILFVIKVFYYILKIISRSYYVYFKNTLFYIYFNKNFNLYNKNLNTTVILNI